MEVNDVAEAMLFASWLRAERPAACPYAEDAVVTLADEVKRLRGLVNEVLTIVDLAEESSGSGLFCMSDDWESRARAALEGK